ncbi:MAG: signal peptidase II [Thermoflavifilum sp.]|nr:signal peptidase II [Thermoflavifilum sp.]MCL6513289.1 signal peptidase II [Alicyclobacillus sp.]
MWVYLCAAIVYAADQWIKWVVRSHLALGQIIPIAPPYVVLTYIRNPGAAWGVLPGARGFLVLVALVVAAIVVFVERTRHPGRTMQVALGLVLGGALGNLTDRILHGTVVDYVYLAFIHFPVFNLADVAIDAGAILLLWCLGRQSGASRRMERSANAEGEGKDGGP